jgi:AcrR family transcriptional regulator
MSTEKSVRRGPGRPRSDPARDLRRDLLATSRLLLDEGGPAALSLRDVARRTGCTHQAPYHYFADRESILAVLVAEGFDELARGLREANDIRPQRGVRAALFASGHAYVDFALSHPGVFRIMFRPDVCNPARFPDVQQAGGRARAELERLNVIVHGDGAQPELATVLWAHVHGLACLLVDGPLAMQFESAGQRAAFLEGVGGAFADRILGAVPAGPGDGAARR